MGTKTFAYAYVHKHLHHEISKPRGRNTINDQGISSLWFSLWGSFLHLNFPVGKSKENSQVQNSHYHIERTSLGKHEVFPVHTTRMSFSHAASCETGNI